MLKYSHPWLAVMLEYWPATILLPTVLILIAVLAVVTHWWDRRDATRTPDLGRRAHQGARSAGR